MIGIYKITNLINGKCYIGQSDNIKRRWKDHKKCAFWKNGPHYEHPLYRAMRKYGLENFVFEILEECKKEELDNREIFYISEYQSLDDGYNLTDGGSHCNTTQKLSYEDVSNIIHRLKTTLDNMFVIASDFNVHWTTIRTINAGLSHVRENEKYPIRGRICTSKTSGMTRLIDEPPQYVCKTCGAKVSEEGNICRACLGLKHRKSQRPEPLELARIIKENGFTRTGKMFGVDANAIKKWCDAYNIPRLLKELIAWYNDQVGIENISVVKKEKKSKQDMMMPVNQIDKTTGEIINTFPSVCAAGRYFNHNSGSHISDVCSGKRKSAYGYCWQYA